MSCTRMIFEFGSPGFFTKTPSNGYSLLCHFVHFFPVNVGRLFSRVVLCVCLWSAVLLNIGRRCRRSFSAVNAPSGARAPNKLCPGFFYMFRSKRNTLIKRLGGTSPNEAQRTVEAVLRLLELPHLEALAISVKSQGAEESPCMPLPADEPLRPGRGPPHLLFCQLWRWADVRHPDELRQLPCCRTRDSVYLCANPYHWSRLYDSDFPPPPYTSLPQEITSSIEDSVHSAAVMPDSGTCNLSGSKEGSRSWCKVAYWELNKRIGRLLPISQTVVNVFNDLPRSDGLCLRTLTDQVGTPENPSILRTRAKIGQGVTLFRENDEVWLYNRSDHPVFLSSPTLDPPNTSELSVHKVLPGYSLKIFDYGISRHQQRVVDRAAYQEGFFDPYTVRISFVKGWGTPKYRWACILSCPCWLEVHLQAGR